MREWFYFLGIQLFYFIFHDEFITDCLSLLEITRWVDRLSVDTLTYKGHQCILQNYVRRESSSKYQTSVSILKSSPRTSAKFTTEFDRFHMNLLRRIHFRNDPKHGHWNAAISYGMCGCSSWHFLRIHAVRPSGVFIAYLRFQCKFNECETSQKEAHFWKISHGWQSVESTSIKYCMPIRLIWIHFSLFNVSVKSSSSQNYITIKLGCRLNQNLFKLTSELAESFFNDINHFKMVTH